MSVLGNIPKPALHRFIEPLSFVRTSVKPLGKIFAAMIPEDWSVVRDVEAGMVGLQWKIVYDDPTFGIKTPGGCAAVLGGLNVTDEEGNVYRFAQPRMDTMSGDLYINERRVITLNRYGRYNGDNTAWDPLRKAIAGIIIFDAKSNLGALISIITNPPKIPFTGQARIPVFSTFKEGAWGAPYLPLSGLWKWKNLPSPYYIFTFKVYTVTPEKRTLRLCLWDSGRNEVDAVQATLEGDTAYQVSVLMHCPTVLETEGFFEITPTESPDGIVVEDLQMIPPPPET